MPLYNATIVGAPQPGTTNTPVPAGPVPPYVPVVTTIVDDSAILIAAKTLALTQELVFIDAAINQINNNLSKQLAQQEDFSNALSKLEIRILSWAAATTDSNVIASAEAASVIQKNNFDKAMSKDTPELPPIQTQIEESIESSIVVNQLSAAPSTINGFISNQSTRIFDWITETEIFRSVKSWLTKQLDLLKAKVLGFYNTVVDAIKSNVKAIAGDKTL